MREFIKGLELCERFFGEAVKPLLADQFPSLQYSAGLIGYNSDVLGFDDEVSTAHMWGPRLYLFLKEKEIGLKEQILTVLSENLPYMYLGYSVNFSKPDTEDGGIRHAELITSGAVSPLIDIHTSNEYLLDYLGTNNLSNLFALDWLAFSENKLHSLTSGKLFVDDLQLRGLLDRLRFYPTKVQLFLIASNWSLIAEEQAFVKRCSDVGDEIGSILACGRITERLMWLAFLYCEQYAPYSKWFGKAFGLLPIPENIKTAIRKAVSAADICDRENNIVLAQKLMVDLHNSFGMTKFVDVRIEKYFNRDIKVIFADKISKATAKELLETSLKNYPLIGSLSEIANFVTLTDDPKFREKIKALYAK